MFSLQLRKIIAHSSLNNHGSRITLMHSIYGLNDPEYVEDYQGSLKD